jgi:hypothetical protein
VSGDSSVDRGAFLKGILFLIGAIVFVIILKALLGY